MTGIIRASLHPFKAVNPALPSAWKRRVLSLLCRYYPQKNGRNGRLITRKSVPPGAPKRPYYGGMHDALAALTLRKRARVWHLAGEVRTAAAVYRAGRIDEVELRRVWNAAGAKSRRFAVPLIKPH